MNKRNVIAIFAACVVVGVLAVVAVNNMSPGTTGPTEDERKYVASAYVYVLAAGTAYNDFAEVAANSTLGISAKVNKATECKDRLERIKTSLSATQYPASLKEAHEAARDYVGHLLYATNAYLDGFSALDDLQFTRASAKFAEAKAHQDESLAAFSLFTSLVKATLNGS